jgi:hypothetical protein
MWQEFVLRETGFEAYRRPVIDEQKPLQRTKLGAAAVR